METNQELIAALERSYKEKEQYLKRGLELSSKKFESDETDKISPAFAGAQSEFPAITKSSKAYNYKYCPLEEIIAAVRPVLKKWQLSISQYTDENMILYTRIRHTSGQYFESRIKLREVEVTDGKRSTEQALGSLLTYMRRYQLCALLGVQPESEDDDAAVKTYNK